MFRLVITPSGQSVVLGASFAFALAIVGLGAVRYRGTQNPSALFLTLGFAVLAANILLILWWSGLHPSLRGVFRFDGYPNDMPSLRSGRQILGWWFVGWVGAGGGMLILRPWWDRRGRKPLDPRVAAAITVAAAVVLDLIVALGSSATAPTLLLEKVPRSSGQTTFSSVHAATPGATAWIAGIIAIGILLGAGARSIGAAWGRILPLGAAALAALGIGLQLQKVTLATYAFRWSDLAFPMALACVFGALLVDERADHTRMRRATDRARAVMGGRAEIASMLGHEVKGPVATIRGLAATTLAHYDRLADAERQEFLSLIEEESRKLLTTVDQASLGMKIDARTLSFVTHPTDLAVVVREVLDKFEPGEHEITVTSPDTPATAVVDRKWLAEALRQLIVNAATFSPPASPIKVAVRQVDMKVAAIDVIDAGPGVPEDRREAVFEKFAAWRPPGYEEVAGTGLGLFIARGITRAHGGELHFADEHTEGTMLSIRLPVEGPTKENG